MDLQQRPWRAFEVTTAVTVPDAKGKVVLWLPIPSVDSGFQKSLASHWTGNAVEAEIVSDDATKTSMLRAGFASGTVPQLSLTSQVQTLNRVVDWSERRPAQEDPAVLAASLAATALQPIDGIVCDTALAAIGSADNDRAKAAALYRWVVDHAYRNPKTRGCGTGDIVSMLTSGDLGGKCADLSALFVAMARSIGLPARDVYGVRVAPSSFGYRELGGNPAELSGAQHCRAEVFLADHGWVAMDPADVLKVMRQETPTWIKDVADPLVAPVNKALFGGWEGNWVAWNTGHDIRLPGSPSGTTVPFLMYPQGEDDRGRFDELAADTFRYTITSREI